MQLTHATERGCPAIQVEMTVDHAKSCDRCDPHPALLNDRLHHWPAEVLFVTIGAHRRDSIKEAHEKWKFGRGGEDMVVRAMTLGEARAELYREIHAAEFSDRSANADLKRPTAHQSAAIPAASSAEERLRPGRVAVRGEQLIAVDAFLRAASRAMEAMRKDLLAAKLAVPPIPNAATLMSAF